MEVNSASAYHKSKTGFHPLELAGGESGAESNNPNFDDDGRPKRTGTEWTASAHIITSVIGSGILSLTWAIAQLGWIAGPLILILFAFVTYHTSLLLAHCYRSGDPEHGKRNPTYMDAVKSILSGTRFKICGFLQYISLIGTSIGYTIAASISMMAVVRTNCYHKRGQENPCKVPSYPYLLVFGLLELVVSQVPDFHQMWWLSILAAVMSFAYAIIGLLLGFLLVIKNGGMKGTVAGTGVLSGARSLTAAQKTWGTFQSLGDIAFTYTYSIVLIEIQNTIRSPPSEVKTMKKANLLSVSTSTILYIACGCMGYAAFGNSSPGNLLTGFGYYNPYWLVNLANVAVVIHLVGAYQVFAQPLFAFVEGAAAKRWPESPFVMEEVEVMSRFSVNRFRLAWRTAFVVATTAVAMAMPFFNEVLGVLGAIGFWPLTVYFPVEMYIVQMKVERWSSTWVRLQLLSVVCLLVSIVAAIGSVAGVAIDLKSYNFFDID